MITAEYDPKFKNEFVPFPKLYRIAREMIVTEKVDGTNAQIYISDEGRVRAASRGRWITPENDNFGFAKWVHENREELQKLGPGRHYGEWYGLGIQRGYGLSEKRFALFNTSRWTDSRPACCDVVPVLYTGEFDTNVITEIMTVLKHWGSKIVPGFMDPEGVVIYHTQSNYLFKKTFDDNHKGIKT